MAERKYHIPCVGEENRYCVMLRCTQDCSRHEDDAVDKDACVADDADLDSGGNDDDGDDDDSAVGDDNDDDDDKCLTDLGFAIHTRRTHVDTP